MGFSQGTMVALELGLPRRFAGILGYSGALLPSARTASGADVLLVHGAADDVLPVAGMYAAVAELAPLGARVRYHVRPELGHSIDHEGSRWGDFASPAPGEASMALAAVW